MLSHKTLAAGGHVVLGQVARHAVHSRQCRAARDGVTRVDPTVLPDYVSLVGLYEEIPFDILAASQPNLALGCCSALLPPHIDQTKTTQQRCLSPTQEYACLRSARACQIAQRYLPSRLAEHVADAMARNPEHPSSGRVWPQPEVLAKGALASVYLRLAFLTCHLSHLSYRKYGHNHHHL